MEIKGLEAHTVECKRKRKERKELPKNAEKTNTMVYRWLRAIFKPVLTRWQRIQEAFEIKRLEGQVAACEKRIEDLWLDCAGSYADMKQSIIAEHERAKLKV
jgi:hypothetical protein